MIQQIRLTSKNKVWPTEFKSWKFPAGEIGIKLLNPQEFKDISEVSIKTRLNDSDSIIELMMAVDAIRRINDKVVTISLTTPIIPYARQDRVCVNGESFSLEVFAGIINSLGFSEVRTFEPHSKVSFEKIRNLKAIDLDKRIYSILGQYWSKKQCIFVAPDKGAVNRVEKLNKLFGGHPIAVANKVRDLTNGNIIGMELEGDVEGKSVCCFDDLADGARTFVELHKLLKEKGAAKTTLFVIHGVFSKGIECVTDIYDEVYTTNTFQDFDFELPRNFKVIDIY